MKLIKLSVVTLALALAAIACTESNTNTGNTGPKPTPAASPAASAAPTPDAMAETREYYLDNCANCHKEDGEGGMVKIEDKRLKVPPFSKGHALSHTDEEFAKQISNGGDGMPAYKDKLTPEQINNLVRFIRTQYQKGASKPSAPVPGTTPVN
jgi:mono/diheme cytochrome c family protein